MLKVTMFFVHLKVERKILSEVLPQKLCAVSYYVSLFPAFGIPLLSGTLTLNVKE